MAKSDEVIAEIKAKAENWKGEKELELLRHVAFLKNVTSSENELSEKFLENTYIDVVTQIDNIKGSN